MKSFYFSFLSLVLLLSCQPNNNSLEKTPLINISTANDSLTIFGENVISTPLYERDLAINPQSDEIIYTLGDYKQSKRCLVVLSKVNGKWTKPKIMPISGKYHDIEPFYTQNGNRLFFASNRPIYKDSTRSDYNIWYSDKKKGVGLTPIKQEYSFKFR